MGAFITPRGVKIRMPVEDAFAMMGRLYPKRKPEEILKTVEGLDFISNMVVYITLLFLIYMNVNIISFILLTSIAVIFAKFIVHKGLIFSHRMIIPYYLSLIPFTIWYAVMFVFAFLNNGLSGVGILLGALIISFVIENIYESFVVKAYNGKITMAEIEFILAYRLHAVSVNIAWEEDCYDMEAEIENNTWEKPLYEYISKFPHTIRN